MGSFAEALSRLKAVHEQEVLGLQNKLLELNSERCRDAQRAEELCSKNRQLREQQKALKDNVRVLENRLRAGLCDRCTVTQDLARKKQQEFESALLQHLQHICSLTNELNRLQEENETLKEEVTRLRGSGPKPPCGEGTPDTTSPPPCTSPGARKDAEEKPPGEEAEDHPPEKLAFGKSPGARASSSAAPAEPRAPDVSPQRISNQLHGTIAVVRPGARACPTDRAPTNGTPPALGSPPSPPYELGLPLDSFLRASRPSAVTYESLKQSLQADRLCLLSHRLSLHLRSCRSSPRGPTTAPGGPPPQGLKAGDEEAWEAPPGLLGLSGPLVDLRGPRLEGALSLLLAQQLRAQGQADGARLRGPHRPGETLPSPPVGSDSEGPEGEVARAALPRKRHRRPTGSGSPRAKEARTSQDHTPDKPLDLSEWGRGREAPKSTGRPGSLSPSPEPPQGAEPPAQSGPWGRSNGTKGTGAPEPEEPCPLEDPPQPLPGPQPSLPSPGGPGDESGERPKPSPHPQRPGVESPPELSKPEAQPQVPDKPDTPDASEDEVGPGLAGAPHSARAVPGAGAIPGPDHTPPRQRALSPKEPSPSAPGKAPQCVCASEPRQGRPPKRKQAPPSDQQDEASKKLS